LRNKRALFKVSVRDLREKILPDIDDELAKDTGEHETLEELRAAIRARLEKAAAERAENELREQLLDKLIEKNPVPLPPSMVNEAERAMAQELAYFMQMTGSAGQELAAGLGEALHSQAERRVRISILTSELARQADVK